MKINEQHYQGIRAEGKPPYRIKIIDQRHLPHRFVIETLTSVAVTAKAITEMHVRGAPLIGVTAGYGMYLAALEANRETNFDEAIRQSADILRRTRPTAVDLHWAIDRVMTAINEVESIDEKINIAFQTARIMEMETIENCRLIGENGLPLIEKISKAKNGEPVNILTHCNAGWLATVDYGTATAPIYAAHDKGIPVHVWVDETRPRNQGARLTAWELHKHGVPHTVIADNTGGHLMQHGLVDMVIVGSDRTTVTGDVANKIGTYLKALAAKDNDIPFYVALPESSFDWSMRDGVREIPIEKRSGEEVKYINGLHQGEIKRVLLTPEDSEAVNYAFDVTPARLVSGLITERGICAAEEKAILRLFPEYIRQKDEGYIKFICKWVKKEVPGNLNIETLNRIRQKFYDQNLIGAYDDGTGFGNVSQRLSGDQFIITGSGTGGIPNLNTSHFAIVTNFDIENNTVVCEGLTKASSEAMSHAAIYRQCPKVNFVVHIHSPALWKKWLYKVPTTDKSIAYGTPEMAFAIQKLLDNEGLCTRDRLFVTAGHEEGIFIFGTKEEDLIINFPATPPD